MIVFAKYLALQLFNDFYYFPLRFKLFGFSFTMDRQQSVVRRLCVKQLPLSTVIFDISTCVKTVQGNILPMSFTQ